VTTLQPDGLGCFIMSDGLIPKPPRIFSQIFSSRPVEQSGMDRSYENHEFKDFPPSLFAASAAAIAAPRSSPPAHSDKRVVPRHRNASSSASWAGA
jgi:hypothetical protein